MSTNLVIDIVAFGVEIGKLGYDINTKKSFFQYNPELLESGRYSRMFPYLFKRVKHVQVFTQFEGKTFKGLPPMIADSLPDVFGNLIFKEWFEARHSALARITPLEQLTYIANRGMGALEYRPVKEIGTIAAIDIDEIVKVLNKVMRAKKDTSGESLSDLALLTIFKIGTSAGGARPKILVSEHKQTGTIIPGDIEYSDEYAPYLVKLSLDEAAGYNKEIVEYAYYLLAKEIGIAMMNSKLIDGKHFATLRYDRQNGKKKHVLTACGLTGWDFLEPENASYENLFRLASDLKVPHKDLQELYKRMVFNLVFANIDDHLKNHSFIYDEENNSWNLAPAYDLTYPLNALNNYLRVTRALAVNGKREGINGDDLLEIAATFAIKNPKGIIREVQNATALWPSVAAQTGVPDAVITAIGNAFETFLS